MTRGRSGGGVGGGGDGGLKRQLMTRAGPVGGRVGA